LSRKDIVNEFVVPLVAIDRDGDRMKERAMLLLEGMTRNEKGDPVT